MRYTVGQKIRASYWISVYKPNIGGYRDVRVSAELQVVGPGIARVIQARLDPARSNRQRFNVGYTEGKEIGVIKLINRLWNVEVIE